MLGIETGRLLFNRTKGAGNGDCGKFTYGVLRNIHIRGQFYSIAVMEGNLTVIDQFGFRESLVPFLCKGKCAHIFCFYVAA